MSTGFNEDGSLGLDVNKDGCQRCWVARSLCRWVFESVGVGSVSACPRANHIQGEDEKKAGSRRIDPDIFACLQNHPKISIISKTTIVASLNVSQMYPQRLVVNMVKKSTIR